MTGTLLSIAPSKVNRSANGASRRLRNSTKLTFLDGYTAHLCAWVRSSLELPHQATWFPCEGRLGKEL